MDQIVTLKSTSKQVLFPSLISSTKANLQESFSPNPNENDILLSAWRELFDDVLKLDYESILTYTNKDLDNNCSIAIKLFKHILSNPNLFHSKHDLMKILIVSFKHYSLDTSFTNSIDNLQILINYLVLTLEHSKIAIGINKFDIVIFKLVKEVLIVIHKNFIEDEVLRARFLYCQFQALAILAALNEEVVNTRAQESITAYLNTFDIFLRESISNPSLSQVYSVPIGENEAWISLNNTYSSVIFNKVKFNLIHMGKNKPKFSIRYIALYYMLKFIHLLASKKVDELILETISTILKQINRSSEGDVEMFLNEALVSLKIVRRVLPNMKKPSKVLEKIEIKLLAETYIQQVHRANLYEPYNTFSKKNYISKLFNTLSKLRNEKSLKDNDYNVAIVSLVEEVIGKFIALLNSDIGYGLKVYVIKYLYSNRTTLSLKVAESITRLIASKAINFTLTLKEENTMESIMNKELIITLIELTKHNEQRAQSILKLFIKSIREHTDEAILFCIHKLLLCVVKRKVYDDNTFYKKIFSKEKPKITFKKYKKLEEQRNEKTVKVFIDIKGEKELVDIFLKLEKGNLMKMTRSVIVKLIPYMSKIILKDISILLELCDHLKEYPQIMKVVISVIQSLLSEIKYNLPTVKDKTDYVVSIIVDMFKRNRSNKNAVVLMDLITNFIEYEEGVQHMQYRQEVFKKNMIIDLFFSSLKENRHKVFIGRLINLFIKLIGNLIRQNDVIATYIYNSPLISDKELLHFIRMEIVI